MHGQAAKTSNVIWSGLSIVIGSACDGMQLTGQRAAPACYATRTIVSISGRDVPIMQTGDYVMYAK
jgi:hypothetical protein